MRVILINAPLVGKRGDPFGSIPSMPVGTPYLAAALRREGHDVELLDSFGLDPKRATAFRGDNVMHGLPPADALSRIKEPPDLLGISVHAGAVHGVSMELLRLAKERWPELPVAIGGAQATMLPDEFLAAGADYVVLGEGEESLSGLLQHLGGARELAEIDGLAWPGGLNPKTRFIEDLDALPFPAWELLPLDNYWELGYSHGPFNGPYLPLITSRGCPFTCRFCAAPALWQRKWRARSAGSVVAEMRRGLEQHGVRDFHIQDDNMTFNKRRTGEICAGLAEAKLGVTWCLAAGMKAETVDDALLRAMKDAGCRYISVSPESGSPAILKLMDKPFDYGHFLGLQRAAHRIGVSTQVCFVIGFPGESEEDRRLTADYLGAVTKAGADEVSIFIMTPLPGAECWKDSEWPYGEYENLSFSPTWRPDYGLLASWRKRLFIRFFLLKALYHPLRLLRNGWNVLRRRFETKSEMTVYRLLKTRFSRA